MNTFRGKALLWESSSIDSRSHSNDHGRRRYPPIKSSLLKDMYVGLPLPVATSIRLHAILELCHSSEVWCVAFSPNGAMLATATLDGSVKLWLPGHNNAALSRSVECRGAACEPLLLRWNKVSSSFLCCCRNDHLIYEWNIGSVVEDETLTVLECCRQYDQSFRIVFADFLPNANPSLPDLVVSCTAENHIFLCDASNKPLATFVGGEGTVSSATLISTIPVRKCNSMNADNKSHGLGSFQDLGWRPCGERGSGVRESASLSLGLTTSFKSTSIHSLLVANSKHDDVKLFQVVVSGSVSGPTYEIISISRLSIGLPVISLARFMNCKDESIGGMEPVAIAVLHGGSIVTINLQQVYVRVLGLFRVTA
jgi:WD40 repeat protein